LNSTDFMAYDTHIDLHLALNALELGLTYASEYYFLPAGRCYQVGGFHPHHPYHLGQLVALSPLWLLWLLSLVFYQAHAH